MKRLFLYTICVLSACIVNAQTTNVHLKDGSTTKIKSGTINNMQFSTDNNEAQTIVVYNNGNTKIYTRNELEYIDFYTKSVVLAKEREALIALYNSTNGDNWTRNDNWGSDKPLSEWYGVETDQEGRVIKLSLEKNNLVGTIPESIGEMTSLISISLSNNKLYGEIPRTIGSLKALEYLYLYSNDLTGELPKSIGNCSSLEVLNLAENRLTGTIDAILELTKLEELNLGDNCFEGNIPISIANLTKLYLLILSDNQMTGNIPAEIGTLSELTILMLQNNNFTGNIPESFAKLTNLSSLWLNGNRMTGKISDDTINSIWWSNLSEIYIEQQDGYGLYYNYYVSTNYSQDGKVNQLQKHSKGKGIPIVILGDGFSDRLIADGTFDGRANEVFNAFFAQEPFSSLRHYFDVYAVYAVSEYEDPGQKTVYNISPKLEITESGIDKIKDYVLKVSELNGSLKDVTTLLIPSSKPPQIEGLSYYSMSFGDFSIALTPIRSVTKDINTYLVQHEGGGHAFGLLADEHVNDDATALYPESMHALLDEAHQKGQVLNIDYHNSEETVLWKAFIENPDYSIESIGLYEGAQYSYAKGIYRPTEESIMNIYGSFYNAPSRWAIYQRIMKLAGEECKYEDFLEYDKNALKIIREQKAQTRSIDADKGVDRIKICCLGTFRIKEIRGTGH